MIGVGVLINKFFNNVKVIFRESFINYPLTNISIFIITFFFMFFDNLNFFDDVLSIFLFFSFGCYFIETKKINKIYYIISFVVSILLWLFLENNILDNYFDKVALVYISVLFIYSIYNNYLNSGKNFPQYLENVFRGFFKLSFSYLILALSIFSVLSIFNELIFDLFADDIISDIEIFLLGVYYFSNVICIFRGINNNEGTFFKSLIRKIVNPLLYITLVIIYLFIIRLFIDGNIDEDYVYYIVSYLFLFGVPIIMMCSSYEDNNMLDKINSYSSYLFIPLVLLQLYLIICNINLYGINDSNYLWVMIIILEIFYLIFDFKKIDYGNLLIVISIIVIITYIVPFINLDDLVLRSQYNNLKLYKVKNEYSEIEKIRIYNAYDYFRYYKPDYISELGITDNDIKIIKTFDENYVDYEVSDKYDSMNTYNYNIEEIDISGYDKLYNISIDKYNLNIEYIDKLIVNYNNKYVEFDFYEYYNNYYIRKDNYQKFKDYFINNNTIILGEQYKLILTRVDVSYVNGMITGYNIDGYLLVKEI